MKNLWYYVDWDSGVDKPSVTFSFTRSSNGTRKSETVVMDPDHVRIMHDFIWAVVVDDRAANREKYLEEITKMFKYFSNTDQTQ